MYRLPYIFTILKYSGIWRPIEWSSGWKRNIYWLYTAIVIVAIYTFSLSEAVYVFQCIDDLDEMASRSFMFFTIVCVACKAGNILNRRRDIIRFENIFKNENCRANGPHETDILNKCNTQIKQTTLWYVTVVGSAVAAVWTASLITNVPRQRLIFNAWIPFNYTKPMLFWSVYLHQMFSHALSVGVCVAYDGLLWAIIIQACGQLKMLKFRLEFMPRMIANEADHVKNLLHEEDARKTESRILARCINQHREIFHFAESVNSTFSVVIFLQCVVSTFVLCISIYALSRMKPFSSEFTSIMLYTFCMLTEIFIYCWFGNQIIIESMGVGNAVYAMDWSKLSVKTQKNLVVLMICSIRPIRFTTVNVIVLSLDTFISLLKLSYSTFNLLQQTSRRQ